MRAMKTCGGKRDGTSSGENMLVGQDGLQDVVAWLPRKCGKRYRELVTGWKNRYQNF
jgi:hypothetical protein